LIVGGALGNVADRLRFGYVVDYLDVHVWPVFNLADAAIVVGAGVLAAASVMRRHRGDSGVRQ
jgi:signal peptidase II